MAFQRIFWCLRGMQLIFCTVSGQYSATPDSFFGLMLNKKTCLGFIIFIFLSYWFPKINLAHILLRRLLGDNFISTVIIWKSMRKIDRMGEREQKLNWESAYRKRIYIAVAEVCNGLQVLGPAIFIFDSFF